MTSPTSLIILLRSSEVLFDEMFFQINLSESEDDDLLVKFSYNVGSNIRINKYVFNIPAFKDEMIWGGGEQLSYLNLREGQNYPIWVNKTEKSFILNYGIISVYHIRNADVFLTNLWSICINWYL